MSLVVGDVREASTRITYHVLTPEGPVEDSYAAVADFYVSNDQLKQLWDPEVIKHILSKYGSIVGVMHDIHFDITPPRYPTYLCVLG